MNIPTEEEIANLRKKAAQADEAISAIDEALGNGSDEKRWPPGMSRFNAIRLMGLDYAACKTGMENREIAKQGIQEDLAKANTALTEAKRKIKEWLRHVEWTHDHHCDEAYSSRGLHATDCLLYEKRGILKSLSFIDTCMKIEPDPCERCGGTERYFDPSTGMKKMIPCPECSYELLPPPHVLDIQERRIFRWIDDGGEMDSIDGLIAIPIDAAMALRKKIGKMESESNEAKFGEPKICFYGGDLGSCIEEEDSPERICNACALSFSTFALNEVTKENEKLKEDDN